MKDKNYWKNLLEVITAFAEGKNVQIRSGSGWSTSNQHNFDSGFLYYRIKPEYRPYQNTDALLGLIEKNVCSKSTGERYSIKSFCVSKTEVVFYLTANYVRISDILVESKNLLEYYECSDGTPLGVIDA